MSRQGRRPTPDYIKQMKGEKIANEEGQIVIPLATTLLPPPTLSVDAMDVWIRMTDILKNVGILTKVSRDKLARYCQAMGDWEEIMEARNKLGAKKFTVTERNWRQMVHWQKCLTDVEKIMQDFEREYGLTPASAAKVRLPRGGGQTPTEQLNGFISGKPAAKNVTPPKET